MAQGTRAGLAQRPGVKQFIKFCIIGFSSALIDIGISYTLAYHFGVNITLAKVISFLFAVTNGFIWNSRWTFKGMGSGRRHELYIKFLLVNCIGLCLNVFIFKFSLYLFTGQFIGQPQPKLTHFVLATGVATVCVAAWNFMANKKWTFKHSHPTHPNGTSEVMLKQD